MTTTKLISNIKLITHVPTAQSTYNDSDFLSLANMELQNGVVPFIISVREGYYLTYKDYPLNSENYYTIPTRALGGKLSTVQLIVGNNVYKMPQIDVNQIVATSTSPFGNYSFYMQGNDVVLTPPPNTGFIRVYYYERPNELVSLTEVGTITDIDPIALTVTVNALPGTIMVGSPCDFVKAKAGFQCVAQDVLPTLINTNIVSFDSLPFGLSVGDYLCIAEQAPVAQIPEEFNPLLIQRVSVKICETQGYLQKFTAAQKKLEEMETSLINLITPRVDGNLKKINNNNSTLRANNIWYGPANN